MFIKKYKLFTEEVTAEAPVLQDNEVLSTDLDVINRFSNLYKDLSVKEKEKINNYFK